MYAHFKISALFYIISVVNLPHLHNCRNVGRLWSNQILLLFIAHFKSQQKTLAAIIKFYQFVAPTQTQNFGNFKVTIEAQWTWLTTPNYTRQMKGSIYLISP
jgi:hypothetical protein